MVGHAHPTFRLLSPMVLAASRELTADSYFASGPKLSYIRKRWYILLAVQT
jgi:hypothetical protein